MDQGPDLFRRRLKTLGMIAFVGMSLLAARVVWLQLVAS